jgi:hypothetical protein
VYTVKHINYVEHPVLGRLPHLLLTVYPRKRRGVRIAVKDDNQETGQAGFLPEVVEQIDGAGSGRKDAPGAQEQVQEGPGQPNGIPGGLNPQPANVGPTPVVSLRDAVLNRFNALPLNADDPALSQPIRDLVAEASGRWLEGHELNPVLEYFHQLQGVEWPTHAANMPQGKIYAKFKCIKVLAEYIFCFILLDFN